MYSTWKNLIHFALNWNTGIMENWVLGNWNFGLLKKFIPDIGGNLTNAGNPPLRTKFKRSIVPCEGGFIC